MTVSLDFLKECVYVSGADLIWKSRPRNHFANNGVFKAWNKKHAGQVAGVTVRNRRNEYKVIQINNAKFPAHRLVYALVNGGWPDNEVDHIDGNGLNNSIENLRDVHKSINLRNSKLRKDNNSGIAGVRWFAQRNVWHASIKVAMKSKCLGQFDSFLDACAARISAANKYGFTERHGREALLS